MMTTDAVIDKLFQAQLLTSAQSDALRRRVQRTGQGVFQALAELKFCDEARYYPLLAEQSGLQLRDLAGLPPPEQENAQRIPARIALQFRCVPLKRDGSLIEVAFAAPPEATRLDQLELLTGCAVQPVLSLPSQIDRRLELTYGLGADSLARLPDRQPSDQQDGDGEEQATQGTAAGNEDSAQKNAQSTASRIVNQLVEEAIRTGATDIHIEQFRRRLRARLRIDGRLRDVPLPEGINSLAEAIVSRVKVMAQLDIAEKRLPQDGRIRFQRTKGGAACDLRVSTLPTRFGENICMRLLNLERLCLPMNELGLDDRQLRQLRRLVSSPNGLVLVTGPTGCGKTTTLYSVLNHLREKMADAKIITVEDPVEYEMAGITQIQIHSGIGLTFSTSLRAILRHDPDVILIGEVRDAETAEIAIQAALTGHLVFATLHTNDSVGAVSRIVNMGVAPDLVATSLRGVVAQRLVRRLCRHCARPDDAIPPEVAEEIARSAQRSGLLVSTPMAASPKGCPECGGTGYSGRVALYEMFFNSPQVETLVEAGASSGELRQCALENGLRTIREDGMCKVAAGITSVEEVSRVAPSPLRMDEDAPGGPPAA